MEETAVVQVGVVVMFSITRTKYNAVSVHGSRRPRFNGAAVYWSNLVNFGPVMWKAIRGQGGQVVLPSLTSVCPAALFFCLLSLFPTFLYPSTVSLIPSFSPCYLVDTRLQWDQWSVIMRAEDQNNLNKLLSVLICGIWDMNMF